MVHIFYYRSLSKMPADYFEYYLQQAPPVIQKKIMSFKQWQDAERSLAGNILLLKGLQWLDIPGYELSQLKYTPFQKPYFDESLHFNISHSGQYTICAISQANLVGIDVEEIKEIPLMDFTDFFYDKEWQEVLHAPDPLRAFYILWTKKEAFLKVIGSGLNVPLNQVIIENNRIRWQNSAWLLQEIPLDPTHICHICSNEPLPGIKIKSLKLWE